jgi:hypothetical protein
MHIFHFYCNYESSVFEEYTGKYANNSGLREFVIQTVDSLKTSLTKVKTSIETTNMLGNVIQYEDEVFQVILWCHPVKEIENLKINVNNILPSIVLS